MLGMGLQPTYFLLYAAFDEMVVELHRRSDSQPEVAVAGCGRLWVQQQWLRLLAISQVACCLLSCLAIRFKAVCSSLRGCLLLAQGLSGL